MPTQAQLGSARLSSCLLGSTQAISSVARYQIQSFDPCFQDCIKEWWRLCQEKGVPVSQNFSLMATLGDPVTTRAWHIAGLPVDRLALRRTQSQRIKSVHMNT